MRRFLSGAVSEDLCTVLLVFAATVGGLALAGNVAAQEPTDAQKSAVKANCRSDFMSLCSGVPRGGQEALQCLKNNVASLSAGCQQAVKAIVPAPPPAKVTAPAAPPPAAPPPAAATAPAPAVGATPAAPAPTAATPAPTAAPAPSAATPAPSPAPAKPVAAPVAPVPAAKSAATPPPALAAPEVRVVRPVQVLMLVRNSCRQEYAAHCSGVDVGGGRVIECLEANAASLSPGCRGALADLGR